MTKAKSFGFECEISIEDGIKDVISWYVKNKNLSGNRYNSFKEKK